MKGIVIPVGGDPYAVWEWDLRDRNVEFLSQIDDGYFDNLARAHYSAIEGDESSHAALALRAVLLEDGKADEAIREFQANLMEAPNNAYALFGLVSAQEAAGDAAGAKVTQALFDKAWAGGADRPTLADL